MRFKATIELYHLESIRQHAHLNLIDLKGEKKKKKKIQTENEVFDVGPKVTHP